MTSSYGSYTASLNSFTSSQQSTNTANANQFSSLNTFSASQNAFTASILAYTASNNATTASLLSFKGNQEYYNSINTIFTASQLNINNLFATQLIAIGNVTSSLLIFSSSMRTFSASVNTFSASVNQFTASADTRFVLTSSFDAYSGSIRAFTASVNVFSASVNQFTASADTRYVLTSSNDAYTGSMNVFSASHNVFTASFNAFSASVKATTASLNAFTASADTRYVLTSSYTSASILGLITGNLDTRYAAFGSGGGSGSGGAVTTASFGAQSASFALVANSASASGSVGNRETYIPTFRQLTTDDIAYSPATFTIIDDDMLQVATTNPTVNNGTLFTGPPYWKVTIGSTTATTGYGFTTGIFAMMGRVGIGQLSSGTGTNASASLVELYSNGSVATSGVTMVPGSSSYFYEATVRIPSASSDANSFTASLGLSNAVFGGFTTATAQLAFTYNHALSGGNWCISNGQGPYIDTGVPMTVGKWYRLGITLSPDCNTASYYVNGVVKYNTPDTLYTPTPSANNWMNACFFIKKNSGTTPAAFLQVDKVVLRGYDPTRFNPIY